MFRIKRIGFWIMQFKLLIFFHFALTCYAVFEVLILCCMGFFFFTCLSYLKILYVIFLILTHFTPLCGLEDKWYIKDAMAVVNMWKTHFFSLTFTAVHSAHTHTHNAYSFHKQQYQPSCCLYVLSRFTFQMTRMCHSKGRFTHSMPCQCRSPAMPCR